MFICWFDMYRHLVVVFSPFPWKCFHVIPSVKAIVQHARDAFYCHLPVSLSDISFCSCTYSRSIFFGFQGATVILSGPSGPPVTTVPGQNSELVWWPVDLYTFRSSLFLSYFPCWDNYLVSIALINRVIERYHDWVKQNVQRV